MKIFVCKKKNFNWIVLRINEMNCWNEVNKCYVFIFVKFFYEHSAKIEKNRSSFIHLNLFFAYTILSLRSYKWGVAWKILLPFINELEVRERKISSTSCLLLYHPVTWGLTSLFPCFSFSPSRLFCATVRFGFRFARVKVLWMKNINISGRKLEVESVYLNDHLNFAINSLMGSLETCLSREIIDQRGKNEQIGANNSTSPLLHKFIFN